MIDMWRVYKSRYRILKKGFRVQRTECNVTKCRRPAAIRNSVVYIKHINNKICQKDKTCVNMKISQQDEYLTSQALL